VTPQELVSAGYAKVYDTTAELQLGGWYRDSYQKHITDEVGMRYFITIAYGIMPHNDHASPFFTPTSQFRKDGIVFNVEMLWHGETREQVEAFFAELWSTMRLDYYEGGADAASRKLQEQSNGP
jgi:hypothetical protein